tara:strand:- start:701 stop:1078 length:378 start_codon:yes stop_codon:yes gene_type:complete
MRVNDAIVEKFVDGNIQMGKLLAVHDEKLDKQDRIDAVLFEKVEHLHKDLHQHAASIREDYSRDFKQVDNRLRAMEKKMWSIFGGLAIISVIVSPVGQRIVGEVLTTERETSMIDTKVAVMDGSR